VIKIMSAVNTRNVDLDLVFRGWNAAKKWEKTMAKGGVLADGILGCS
jgi:hypothetical protein